MIEKELVTFLLFISQPKHVVGAQKNHTLDGSFEHSKQMLMVEKIYNFTFKNFIYQNL